MNAYNKYAFFIFNKIFVYTMDKIREFINKILNAIASMSKDSILHQYASFVIYMFVFLLFNNYYGFFPSALTGFAVTISIGILKEYVIDTYIRKTSIENKDIKHDIIGILLGVLISSITLL